MQEVNNLRVKFLTKKNSTMAKQGSRLVFWGYTCGLISIN